MGTITKALELLNFFSRSRADIGLGEFVKLSQRDKATVHRHLAELLENGFLEQDHRTRAYSLGPAILRLTAVREATRPVCAVLRPLVTEMSQTLGELVHASLLQGERLSTVCHADPALHSTRVHFDDGKLLPLHATASGIAALAFGDDDLRRRVLAGPMPSYTKWTETDPEVLRATIEQARQRGYSLQTKSFNNEVVSSGVPIFGPGSEVIGTLAIAVPAVRADDPKMNAALATMRDGVRRATHLMGGQIPPEHAPKWAENTTATERQDPSDE